MWRGEVEIVELGIKLEKDFFDLEIWDERLVQPEYDY